MSANQVFFAITTMARVLGVTAGYLLGVRLPSARAIADDALLRPARTIHAVSLGTDGAPRFHAELRAEGRALGKKRIARLMRAAGIVGVSRRRGVITTRRDRDARPAPDLVDRNFTADRPNQLWVADITYVPTVGGFLYLAVVLDAFSRRIVGWAMETICAPSWSWRHWRWRSVSASRAMSSTTATKAPSIHRWRSAAAAGKPVCAHQWDLSVRLRQRHVRELLRHTGMRAAGSSPLHIAGRGQDGSLQLHRGVVQSRSPPLRYRLSIPNRQRDADPQGNPNDLSDNRPPNRVNSRPRLIDHSGRFGGSAGFGAFAASNKACLGTAPLSPDESGFSNRPGNGLSQQPRVHAKICPLSLQQRRQAWGSTLSILNTCSCGTEARHVFVWSYSGIGFAVLIYLVVLFFALKYPYAGLPEDPPTKGFFIKDFRDFR